jgi:hypothetical protein
MEHKDGGPTRPQAKVVDEPHAPRRPMPVHNSAGLYAVQQLSTAL